MILTNAELRALRAVVEVAEPSADDAGPMEIWARAMTAMKKIEDDVKSQKDWRPDTSWFPDTKDHPAEAPTCQFTVNDFDFLVCGKPATMKWEDGTNGTPEYFCQEHFNQVRSLGPDSDIDCGWSAV